MNKMQIERLRERLNEVKNSKLAKFRKSLNIPTREFLVSEQRTVLSKASKADLLNFANSVLRFYSNSFSVSYRTDKETWDMVPHSLRDCVTKQQAALKPLEEKRKDYERKLNNRIEQIIDQFTFEKCPNVAQILSDFEKE